MKIKFLPLWLLMVLSLLASAEAYARPWFLRRAWTKPTMDHCLTMENIDTILGLTLTTFCFSVLTVEAHRYMVNPELYKKAKTCHK